MEVMRIFQNCKHFSRPGTTHDFLSMTKISARWVLRLLTDDFMIRNYSNECNSAMFRYCILKYTTTDFLQ